MSLHEHHHAGLSETLAAWRGIVGRVVLARSLIYGLVKILLELLSTDCLLLAHVLLLHSGEPLDYLAAHALSIPLSSQ